MAGFDSNDNESKTDLTAQEKSAIADGIIWGTLTIMKRTISREIPQECANRDSKSYRQSKTALADNTISINVLTDNVKLPARPRDFRYTLSEEECNIGMSELTDVLSSLRRRQLLKRIIGHVPYPRGRPISDSNPTKEKRGRESHYYKSEVNKIINQVINDQQLFKKIDDAVSSSDIFIEHRKYSIMTALYQMKLYEKEFLNTFRPILKKYGLKEAQSDIGSIRKEDITDDVIQKIAICLTHDIMPLEQERKAIYTEGAIIFLDHLVRINQLAT